MLLPIIFPIPILAWPFLNAIMEVTSSGSDVPIATITIPITVVDMPKPSAIPIEPLIVSIPPTHM